MKYKKKPIVIDAFQWTGDQNQTEDPEWIVEAIKKGDVQFENEGTEDCYMKIATLEGMMTASLGDYIIRGIKGEIYPCKPEIFELTYELDDGKDILTAIREALKDKNIYNMATGYSDTNQQKAFHNALRLYGDYLQNILDK